MKTSKEQGPTNEELLNRIRDFYAEHGRAPKESEFDNVSVVIRRFGKWSTALKDALGNEISWELGNYTDGDLISMLRDMLMRTRQEIGSVPTSFISPKAYVRIQYHDHDSCVVPRAFIEQHDYAIQNHFGSWENALKFAAIQRPRASKRPGQRSEQGELDLNWDNLDE
ncbi:hypothetical protein IV38_GL000165 [Lactobacillus selangorensis]|uniref:Uncharacterized protein n=1 Tax=Lactobacillus selangorensis TaxID=81857 RepID=A0A0R2FL01_9LACO|nr:hypothetical protein [Lactobacillus selangorensis]KRN29283.1 hypothetical protein IV38_GL000165 [Lactobacillus selangorensis]KRN34188.1 hypothetical protein IV40_GL000504 [Lactobacillus selangorensis]